MQEHVLVVGATGVCGHATAEYFSAKGIKTTAIARRPPLRSQGGRFLQLDLLDDAACEVTLSALQDVTHVVYAAVLEDEKKTVVGWSGNLHADNNLTMLRNLVEVIDRSSHSTLRNITLVHGGKAYGIHVRPAPLEAREDRDDAIDVPNIFYLDQLQYIRAKQIGRPWGWTTARIGLPVGLSSGGALNTFAGVLAWATVLREKGEPLHYPGGDSPGLLLKPLDTDILARFLDWAGNSAAALNQTFNVTNNELFSWRTSWPGLAAILDMDVGDYRPISLRDELQSKDNIQAWDRARARHNLLAPDLPVFVGGAAAVLDFNMDRENSVHRGPFVMSSIKLHRAGFHEVIHTDEMFRKWVSRYRAARLIPPAP